MQRGREGVQAERYVEIIQAEKEAKKMRLQKSRTCTLQLKEAPRRIRTAKRSRGRSREAQLEAQSGSVPVRIFVIKCEERLCTFLSPESIILQHISNTVAIVILGQN